ncbi:MAG TPA: S9 family peptidase [Candidatus Limnocylindrales bacterium]|nr:S9 family peptidase [Candidatus Limnocylindrales bacterium]
MTPDHNSTAAHLSPDDAVPAKSGRAGLQPPLALREPVEHVIHSDRRVDHYAWLRDKKDHRVIGYLEAENVYADAYLKSTEAFQSRLYQEMLGRILQTDLSVPYTLRGFEYYTRTVEGQQYSIYCRTTLRDPHEQVLLDLNLLAGGHSFMGLGIFEISDDNSLLAYATDTTGFRQYTLELKNLDDSAMLPLRVERVTSAAWSSDNRTLFYVVEDEVTKRSNQLFRHVLGSNGPDTLLYEEKDERFRIDVERSRSGAYIFLVANSHTTSEVRYLRADSPSLQFQLIHERCDDHEYYVDHHPGSSSDPAGGVFFIRTNDNGRIFRLMTAPAVDPVRSRWQEVIPIRPGVMLSGVAAFRSHIVLVEREEGLPHLRIVDLTREAPTALVASKRITFAEPTYNAALGANPEFDATFVRFTYESFITPRSVFDLNIRTGERILRKQQPVLGGYDPALYASERLHAIASDGTKIPISVVYRHDTPRDGSAPLLLYGYGSYGISMPVSFSSNRLSLLDRGMIFAIAHIRGGGELGKPWHDSGRMFRKINTFTDFIACAEDLIAWGFAAKNKLIIEGGSAGGLLMGAVTNLRPDLFRAVVSHVPFVDVLNTMLDPALPLTVGEYEEWGNPQRAEDYFYMKSYCPYTRLERKDYPAMLVKAGLNDSQVMYWEPAKYTAKLRTLKTDDNVLLLKTNMGAGHGGASGRYDYLKEIAFDYAFLLSELGLSQ